MLVGLRLCRRRRGHDHERAQPSDHDAKAPPKEAGHARPTISVITPATSGALVRQTENTESATPEHLAVAAACDIGTDRKIGKRTNGPGVGLETPRNAWCGWDLGDPGPSQPSALPRTLSKAHKMTVTTVIAGQVKHIRTTVEQP